MADRKATKRGTPEDPRDIVELDKDERWQVRIEEARARREIALREKAANPKKKQRRKPWEDEPGDDPDDFEIAPIIQEKPADEKALDFADRLENVKAVTQDAPAPEVETAPLPVAPPVVESPAPKPEKKSLFRSKARKLEEAAKPTATVAPAPMTPRKSPRGGLIADGAPDVIDLAQRYASTLKPPVNVTEPFDTVQSEPSTSHQDAVPQPMASPRSRRPFGLGLVVLAFSLVPLTGMAPPLEKGPPEPESPFFALPPALGLTTSLVWPAAPTQSGEWMPPPAVPSLGAAPSHEVSPLGLGLFIFSASPVAPRFNAPSDTAPKVALEGRVANTVPGVAPLATPPSPDARPQPLEVPVPRPRPVAPAAITPPTEASSAVDVQPESAPTITPETAPVNVPDVTPEAAPTVAPEASTGTVPTDRPSAIIRDISANQTPQARPKPPAPQVAQTTSPLDLTILVPSSAARSVAEDIAADAQARGHNLNVIKDVPLSISTPNVRYFHSEDRAEAVRLGRLYGAEVKDFTWFRPLPEKGVTEIWLSGSGGRAPDRPAPSVRTVEDDAPLPPPRTITVIRKQPTFLERLLTGAEDEIEIILPDPDDIMERARAQGAGQN
jgi:hypothetical protein